MLYGQHRRKGEGVDLLHLREYRSGDPIKRIHWKASARMGLLQVRETEQEQHQAFVIYIDPSPSIWLNGNIFEKMCSLAASLAEDLYQQDRLKGGEIAGHPFIPIGAIEGLYAFLDGLGRLERKATPLGGQPEYPQDTIRLIPGSGESVQAQTEEGTVGQA